MGEFNTEDLDEVIKSADSSLVQMLALQLKSTLQQRDALAAEIDRQADWEGAVIDALESEGIIRNDVTFTRPIIMDLLKKNLKSDAYLNSVRADAVQELADAWYAIANETSDGVSISDSTRLKYRQRADDAADFAAQLRAGEPS